MKYEKILFGCSNNVLHDADLDDADDVLHDADLDSVKILFIILFIALYDSKYHINTPVEDITKLWNIRTSRGIKKRGWGLNKSRKPINDWKEEKLP